MRAKKLAIAISLLLAALGGGARAGQTEVRQSAPVEVVSFEWKYQGYGSRETVRDESTTLSMKSQRAVVYVFKYTAKVSLRNPGSKSIKAVEWNYVFADPESGKELKRYKLVSKQEILPGETQTLSKDVFLDLKDDTRHLKIGKQKIVLTRIEYGDGSSWRP